MAAETSIAKIPGLLLTRGFWLYVWRVATPDNRDLLYVGRTGDNPSSNAAAPYQRMGQHLGRVANQTALKNYLRDEGVPIEECHFEMVCHGPILPEELRRPGDDDTALYERHKTTRQRIAALEKQLAEDLSSHGYTVLNSVHCRQALDPILWAPVRDAFSVEFPRLTEALATLAQPVVS